MKILIVDDSATMRRIVLRTLTDMGYTDCEQAENGQAAMTIFERGGVGMVITDWNMPVMSGLELVTEIRALDAEVPILMVTTNASNQDVVQALKAGVSNYVVKPFTPDTFREKVESMLAD